MEVHVVAGGYGGAVQSGGLVVPAAERGLDFFVDAVADGLDNLGVDYITCGVDGYFDDDVANEVMGKPGAIYGRIGIYGWIGDVDFVAGNRAVDHCYCAQGRSGMGIAITGVRVG
jgi:hypothetical protein